MENTKIPLAIDITPVDIQGNYTVALDIQASEPIPHYDIPSEQLLKALYWIWDAFDRSQMPFFLVNQTAKDAMKQHDLTGDKVEVGVRQVEWTSGGRRIFDAFITPVSETETEANYEFEGVPVVVHVYKDSECIVNTDMVRYRNEEFKIPNPYSKFEEIYG